MSSSADPVAERFDDDWTRRRGVKIAAVVVFVVVVGAVLVVSLALALRDESPSSAGSPGADAGSVGGLGPPPGADLVSYVENRRAALAAASGERVAVVSFHRYTTDAEARATAGGAEVLAVLAAIPGGAPSVVDGEVASWLEEQQESTRTERDEIQKLIPTSGNDPEFKAFYEQEVARLNRLLDSVKPDSDLVFAVVVRAPAAQLQAVAGNADVRLVDIGPSAAADPKAEYRGIRPEEKVTANNPPTRPV